MIVPYLIDAYVIPELRKGKRADPGVTSWFEEIAEEDVYLSDPFSAPAEKA